MTDMATDKECIKTAETHITIQGLIIAPATMLTDRELGKTEDVQETLVIAQPDIPTQSWFNHVPRTKPAKTDIAHIRVGDLVTANAVLALVAMDITIKTLIQFATLNSKQNTAVHGE